MNRMKHSLDDQLSMLDWTQADTQRMLRLLRGETPVKKRISRTLVLALVLVLAAASALAVSLWKNYYDRMAQMEGELSSYFSDWSGQRQAEFVLMMQEEGLQFDKDKVALLEDPATPDEKKSEIATALISDTYGIRPDAISAISILEAEKGPLPGWSLEDKVAYTQMLIKTNTLGHDEEMYLQPGKQDIPQEKAEEIALQALAQMVGDDVLEEVASLQKHAELRTYAHEQEHRTWFVFYVRPGQDMYSPYPYGVWLNAATGEVETVQVHMQDAQRPAPTERPEHLVQMAQAFSGAFKQAAPYTLASLVELTEEWRPKVAEMAAQLPGWDWGGIHGAFKNIIDQRISLPDANAIPYEQALEKARQAVLALEGWNQEKFSYYPLYAPVYYHSQELSKPVYHFFFSWRSQSEADFSDKPYAYFEDTYLHPLFALFGGENKLTPRYISVRLDAGTGELAQPPHVAMFSEESGAPPFEFYLIK